MKMDNAIKKEEEEERTSTAYNSIEIDYGWGGRHHKRRWKQLYMHTISTTENNRNENYGEMS